MAGSVSCGYALWLDGATYNGVLGRTQHVAASFYNSGAGQVAGGVLPSGGQMQVSAGSGMSVNVSQGYCVAPNSSGSINGGYLFSNLASAPLTVQTSDPTNPRVDLVCGTVSDVGSAASQAMVQIVTGTPTPGATLANLSGAPALPANSIPLAYLLVPAGSSSVSLGNLQDTRGWTAAQGGIIPVVASRAIPAGYTGLYVHEQTSGRLAHDPAGTLVQPHVLPWTPQAAVKGTSTNVGAGATVALCSVTVTTDGATDLECTYKWFGLSGGGATLGIEMELLIDGTKVDSIETVAGPNTANYAGGSVAHRTTPPIGSTPAAGTHTITFSARNGGGSTLVVTAPASLYVKAACL